MSDASAAADLGGGDEQRGGHLPVRDVATDALTALLVSYGPGQIEDPEKAVGRMLTGFTRYGRSRMT